MPEGSTSRDQLKEQLKGVAELRTAESRGEKPATNNLLPVDFKDLPKDTLYFSQKAIELAKEPKELYIVPGESHESLYDHIDAAGKKLVEFFTQHIAQ